MQPRALRRIFAGFFLTVFLLLSLQMGTKLAKVYPATVFLELDPLHGLATALATGVLFSGLLLGLIVVGLTLLVGRAWCSWICPLGILQDCASVKPADGSERGARLRNRYRPIYHLKYGVLIAFLVLAALGVTQTGLLDPIALLLRSMVATVLPLVNHVGVPLDPATRLTGGGVFIGLLLAVILVLPRFLPRTFCRVLCPLGALLGLLAKVSIFRIWRDDDKCTHCGACQRVCQGACDPHTKLRVSECTLCFNCMAVCPEGAIGFAPLPARARENAAAPDLTRRRALAAGGAGVASYALLATSVSSRNRPHPKAIRPPGALAEKDFLAKCIKCGACMKVCPTGGLQPAALEAGFEGMWTPILINEIGYCEPNCTRCGRHCPTGAIRPLTHNERVGGPPEGQPIRIGTAFVDRGRCLPWANGISCIVCEEVCPVSPKAIVAEKAETFLGHVGRTGKVRTAQVLRPYVNPSRCIGCGVCENHCPVQGKRGIRVSSVGESRSRVNQILLVSRHRK